jgi:hypothetical protein
MPQGDMGFLAGAAGLLLMRAGYGYLAGRAALGRPWSAKKLRIVALGPFEILTMLGGVAKIVALVISHSREAPTPRSSPGFPAYIVLWALYGAGLIALYVAAKIARPVLQSTNPTKTIFRFDTRKILTSASYIFRKAAFAAYPRSPASRR